MKRLIVPGEFRHPQFRIAIGGTVTPGVARMEVDQNSHYQADTWRATFALNAIGGQTLDWWGADNLKGQLFVLSARLAPTDPWTPLITGEADKIKLVVQDGTVECEGRDLTARLIEAKTQEAFLNQTASEVAIKLAGRHDLTPVVTATTTLVSRYYSDDHDRVTHDQFSHVSTEWDLLAYLAQQENFDLFVVNKELHFQPATAPTADPFVVVWDAATRTGDVINIDLERSLTLAKDVTVIVRSWNSRQGRSFTRASPKGASATATQSGKTQRYVYARPNLTEDQAQKLADSLREQITRHERNGSLLLPIELAATPRDMVRLQGVGASWDQPYYIASIARSFGEDGTTETIAIKNHSPESDAATP